MRRHVFLAAACALAAIGCNRSPTVNAKNATPAEVAKKVQESGADQSMVSAGLWQSKVTIEKLDMPGMPPEMASRMKTMMAQNQAHDFQTCLTAEDVKPRLLGHWGTSPGLSFVYAHVSRLVRETRQEAIYLAGPGHGGPANPGSGAASCWAGSRPPR